MLIEHKDYANLIKVYDRPDALFYVDPPYIDAEKYYCVPFDEDDHKKLANILSNIKGKFIVSYNDDARIRDLYKKFTIIEIKGKNLLGSSNKTYNEILIKNF